MLSRGRGVEACRGLSRPVKAGTTLVRVEGCRGVSRGVEGVEGVEVSSGCRAGVELRGARCRAVSSVRVASAGLARGYTQ